MVKYIATRVNPDGTLRIEEFAARSPSHARKTARKLKAKEWKARRRTKAK
jgi:hypothetical protein